MIVEVHKQNIIKLVIVTASLNTLKTKVDNLIIDTLKKLKEKKSFKKVGVEQTKNESK